VLLGGKFYISGGDRGWKGGVGKGGATKLGGLVLVEKEYGYGSVTGNLGGRMGIG